MMDFWRSITGMLTVEITSADLRGMLQSIMDRDIPVYQIQWINDLTLRCSIHRRDYRRLRVLTEKKGEHVRICGRAGSFWNIAALRKRPVLVIGIMLMLILVLYLPTRVLFVSVEGNNTVPSNRILSAAEESGICFWASRREVRSEKMKNALLSAVPELQWAGVNTRGCAAVISVRERTETETENPDREVCSIVAVRDGIVESCTALEGNLLCYVGQAVKEGEILISGYTDCGISIRATRADGEIFAQTMREMDVIALSQCLLRQEITAVKHKYSLLIGKKRINLWKDSGIWDASCGRMYEEYYITLPGGFRLPVALAVETYTFHDLAQRDAEDANVRASMTEYARNYLNEQMVAGRIRNCTEDFCAEDGIFRLKGTYLCSEMIGRVQREKIGE